MFFAKTARSIALAAASTVASNHELNALNVSGRFEDGLCFIPDLERSHQSVWRSNVVKVEGVQCVALGNGAFVTAGHLGFPKGASDPYRVRASDGVPCDLILFRHTHRPEGVVNLPLASNVDRSRREALVLATSETNGLAWTTPVPPSPRPDAAWARISPAFFIFTPKYGLPGAGTVQVGDSGGAVFRFDIGQGGWILAGVLVSNVALKDPSLSSIDAQGALSRAIDTSVRDGVGQQLIDYRDGALKGGGVMERLTPRKLKALEVGASVALVVGAAGVGGAWARSRARQQPRSSDGGGAGEVRKD